ncbi:MAG: glycosyltransferase family 4 protein [Proteobacteria bacterium]|nr:glycosyltransferase family 4 protein [Pseudomonadota bacterium]
MNQKGNQIVKIAFFQLVCPGYKRSMFEGLQKLPGVDLTLFVGDKTPPGCPPSESLDTVSHVLIQNIIAILFGFTFVWQRISEKFLVKNYDLVLLPEGVLYLSNYYIMLKCWLNKVPFGLYTHGFNYQRRNTYISKLLERLRSFVHRRCDVLIVYSEEGANHLNKINKVSFDKIFIAHNTLDLNAILKRSEKFSEDDLLQCRETMGVAPSDVLLMYVGRISAEKKPEWVIQAVEYIRGQGLSVHAVFIGDGPSYTALKEYVSTFSIDVRSSIHILGRFPMEDVDLYLKSADISVMPGMTGLAIVHSFALGKPYVTVKSPYHSPEICYLHHRENGLMTDNNLSAFCDAVLFLVKNPLKRKAMGKCAYQYAISELSMKNQLNAFEQAFNCIRNRTQCNL